MRIEISPSNTLHGTLILPLTQGDDVADASLTGVPSALKAQIANALSDGDFKGKKGEIRGGSRRGTPRGGDRGRHRSS